MSSSTSTAQPAIVVQPDQRPFARRGKVRDRTQALAMQRAMANLALDDSVPPHIRAQCARAWSDLQNRRREIEGRPLPGQLRPELDQLRKLRRPGKPLAYLAASSDGPA